MLNTVRALLQRSRLPRPLGHDGSSAWSTRGVPVVLIAALTVAVDCCVGVAHAQQQSLRVPLTAFKIEGDNPLSPQRVEEVLSPFYGDEVDIERLQDAATALEDAIRELGYAFYRVNLPPQPLDSSQIILQITGYEIQSISVEGNNHFDRDNVLDSMPEMREAHSPNVQVLSRQLAISNEHPARRVQSLFTIDPTTGGLNARVRVRDVNPVSYFAWVDNTGTERTGDLRLGVGVQHSNFLRRDHNVTATATTSPNHLSDVRQFGIDYRVPLYRQYGQLSFIAADSTINSGQVAEVFEVRGSGTVFGLRYRWILPKREQLNHSVIFSVFDKQFDNDIDFEDTPVGNTVRSRPIAIQYQGLWGLDDVSLGLNAGISYNLGGGTDNNDEAYEAVRAGATNDWTVLRAGASLNWKLNTWAVSAAMDVQYTQDSLIPGEQFAIGGVRTIRGLDESELSNDEGVRLGVELWSPEIRQGLRGVTFLDYGRVWRNGALEDEVERDSVSSIGVGLRYSPNERVRARFDLGYVLDGIDSAQSDLTEDGDVKAHFNVIYRFSKQ